MGFGIILFGYIFILFDFNLNTLNVLPNVAGWIFVILGIQEVQRKLKNNHFEHAKKTVYMITVLTALESLTRNVDFLNVTLNQGETWFGRSYHFLFQAVLTGAIIYFMYEFCKGIEEEALNRENEKLAKKSRKVFFIYALFQGITSFITLIVILFTKQTQVNFNLGIGGMGFLIIFFIALFYLAYQLFSLLNQSNRFFQKNQPVSNEP